MFLGRSALAGAPSIDLNVGGRAYLSCAAQKFPGVSNRERGIYYIGIFLWVI